jgi:hypothetical protein
MSITEKVKEIHKIITEINEQDPAVSQVLLEGFGLSLNILKVMAENGGQRIVDVSEHLQIISNVMGFKLEDLVTQILEQKANEGGGEAKIADAGTLDFITSTADLDDYEKFIAENSAKESLEFLSKEL